MSTQTDLLELAATPLSAHTGEMVIAELLLNRLDASCPNPHQVILESPLSSAILRYSLRTTAIADGPGPHETRPFGLRFARTFPIPPPRPALRYCHKLQLAVDDDDRPMIERLNWEEDQEKEWATKAESDGDEGKEEDTWGWEEK